ncbi:MAG TPA: hypothetical protein PKK00_14625 [Bacteroidales bacterium]|nr:hypothetical protein [Bacteroidales bacterium]HPS18447.1 hypothetical protein [Bacteroidales bacterium]
MKKLLYILFIFQTSIGFSQSSWEDFLSNLSEAKLPLNIDSAIAQNVMISKNDAMKFLIMPATKINQNSEYNKKFEVDTFLINAYKQWDSLDLNKKDTIDIFSATGGGLIFCNKKININDSLEGIIWLYYPNMGKIRGIMYSFGIEYWLFVYDKFGNCKDFILVATKELSSMCKKCLYYSSCSLTQDKDSILKLTISSINIGPKKTSDFFDENPKMITKKKTYHWELTNKGIFIIK